MRSSTTSALLVTSLISVASAFVPMQIAPLPTSLDTNVWIPITTFPAQPAPTAASPSLPPAPTQAPEEILGMLPVLDPNMVPDLKKRQGQALGPAVAPVITQVSPIMTYQINLYRSGGVSQLNIVYTQTFAPVPDQWPSPTDAGTIGLGTIQGQIGVVKTKRSLPTQAPLGASPDSTSTETAPGSDSIPLLDKLRKMGQEIQQEVEELLKKVKKPTSEKDDDLSVPLGKESRLPTTGSSESNDPSSFGPSSTNDDSFHFEGSDKTSDLFSFGGAGTTDDDEDVTHLLPEMRVHDNDARVLKAGSLAIIAVAIGTLCVTHL